MERMQTHHNKELKLNVDNGDIELCDCEDKKCPDYIHHYLLKKLSSRFTHRFTVVLHIVYT